MIDATIISAVKQEVAEQKKSLENKIYNTIISIPELERRVLVGEESKAQLKVLRENLKKLTDAYSQL